MRKFSKEDQALLATWALDCAERVLPFFQRAAPGDDRPGKALEVGREWVRTGIFLMSTIRGASLHAHAAAKEVKADPPASFAAHGCGQAVATAHVPQHAYGSAYYALKAIIASDPESAPRLVAAELEWQEGRLAAHLRNEVMSRVVVEERPKGLFATIIKGPGF